MNRPGRLGRRASGLGAAVILYSALLSVLGLPGPSAQEAVFFDLAIRERATHGVDGPIRVYEGDRVMLRWTTDEAVEIHLHGYDVRVALTPGDLAAMELLAFATGRFEITSHGFGGCSQDHETLIELEVHPR